MKAPRRFASLATNKRQGLQPNVIFRSRRAILDPTMQWESTDNFGNLMVATSEATTPDGLAHDLQLLIDALLDRHEGEVAISVDVPYGEVAGPSGNQVSHIVNCSAFFEAEASQGKTQEQVSEETQALIRGLLSNNPARTVEVQGPWDE